MNKKRVVWILSTFGLASTAFSLVLLFSGVVKAACTVSVACTGGSPISCSGDVCFGGGDYVQCMNNGRNTTKRCKDGGAVEPELPVETAVPPQK